MELIRFKSLNDNPVCVNPDFVEAVFVRDEKTVTLHMASGADVVVQGTFDEVLARLRL